MSANKRSKRHRTNRNHISTKDSVICIAAFAEHARQVEKEYRTKYPKTGISYFPVK